MAYQKRSLRTSGVVVHKNYKLWKKRRKQAIDESIDGKKPKTLYKGRNNLERKQKLLMEQLTEEHKIMERIADAHDVEMQARMDLYKPRKK